MGHDMFSLTAKYGSNLEFILGILTSDLAEYNSAKDSDLVSVVIIASGRKAQVTKKHLQNIEKFKE